ncbi:hypothetical protein Tco_0134406 [Tanacetum coccineum]
MEDEVLYRKSYLVPLMRCVGPLQANYIIRKVHMGSCGMHDWPRTSMAKAYKFGVHWPANATGNVERIFKKRTKRKPKTTKLKHEEKTKSIRRPKLIKVKKQPVQIVYNFRTKTDQP